MEYAIINSKTLGSNCWLPARFCGNTRCQRVEACKYPEKSNCKAVQAEIDYINTSTEKQIKEIQESKQKRLGNLRLGNTRYKGEYIHTITIQDVGKRNSLIQPNSAIFEPLGIVLIGDVGKQIYKHKGVYCVESDKQMKKRLESL
jgi:hypothetical protein